MGEPKKFELPANVSNDIQQAVNDGKVMLSDVETALKDSGTAAMQSINNIVAGVSAWLSSKLGK